MYMTIYNKLLIFFIDSGIALSVVTFLLVAVVFVVPH